MFFLFRNNLDNRYAEPSGVTVTWFCFCIIYISHFVKNLNEIVKARKSAVFHNFFFEDCRTSEPHNRSASDPQKK